MDKFQTCFYLFINQKSIPALNKIFFFKERILGYLLATILKTLQVDKYFMEHAYHLYVKKKKKPSKNILHFFQ